MNDLRQTKEWAEYLKKIGWVVEEYRDSGVRVLGYVRQIPFMPFSILKIQRVKKEQISDGWLRAIQKKHRAVVSYIELDYQLRELEPGELPELVKMGYKTTWNGMLPTKTRIIDLGFSNEELLKQMKAKTRYNIGLAKKHGLGLKIIDGQELIKDTVTFEALYRVIQTNALRVGLFGVSKAWYRALFRAFGNKAYGALINREQRLLAGAVFLTTKDTSYYFYNGSVEEGRKLMAPTLAVWVGMEEARRRGLTTFDFDGVSDERHPTKKWQGFTRFKEGFGGKAVYYPKALRHWGY
jgi:lipid II:glycine glycyltransferase (peptidoglycan interpeptide bridge formation enzyme)